MTKQSFEMLYGSEIFVRGNHTLMVEWLLRNASEITPKQMTSRPLDGGDLYGEPVEQDEYFDLMESRTNRSFTYTAHVFEKDTRAYKEAVLLDKYLNGDEFYRTRGELGLTEAGYEV